MEEDDFGRPLKRLLDEGETGLSRPHSLGIMTMMKKSQLFIEFSLIFKSIAQEFILSN